MSPQHKANGIRFSVAVSALAIVRHLKRYAGVDTINPPKKIVIVGGGSAGWMTANILARALADSDTPVTIQLLESPEIGVIGVGEGSTPALKHFFKVLDIPDSEWMPACNATYKCGITFKNWSTRPGFTQYTHPFTSSLDQDHLPLFIRQTQLRRAGINVDAHPDHFFYSSQLIKQQLAPIPKPTHLKTVDTQYAYHFDAKLLGQFLRKKACARGVEHTEGTVNHIKQTESGNISHLVTENGENIRGDMFVDCSGFASILMEKTLKVPHVSYQDQLFNDSAVALRTDMTGILPSETLTTALKHGWAWKIPLTNRFGHGYVYSSAHCTQDQAETELRQHLGIKDSEGDALHLKMKVGRLQKHWHKNCVALGLSQGFIEPLEATALYLTQQIAGAFVGLFKRGDLSNKYQDLFNNEANGYFDGIKDYIVAHYVTNTRSDTPYWRDNQNTIRSASDSLKHIFECWMKNTDLTAELQRQKIERYYPSFSWHCLLAGMGVFPPHTQLSQPDKRIEHADIYKINDFYARHTVYHEGHETFLNSH